MTITEGSFGSDGVALVGVLLLFSGLCLFPVGRLLAERAFPAPRVLFVRWGFTHLLVTVFFFLMLLFAVNFLGVDGVLSTLVAGMKCLPCVWEIPGESHIRPRNTNFYRSRREQQCL